jgi:lipopolysaccharide/colanic/teichoic acid biosynthesis glycosyltransferase
MMETILGAIAQSTGERPSFCAPGAAARKFSGSTFFQTSLSVFSHLAVQVLAANGRLSNSDMEAHEFTQDQPLDRIAGEPLLPAITRRLMDLVIAAAMIVLLSPLLIAVAIAIRLDSRGPALFRQRRVGYGEREFTIFKFRSMRTDADPGGHRDYVTALIKGKAANGGRENLYKLAVDDRITPVGRWIRRWSLDELPQLFNVVSGDMTLVGPRPAIPYEVAEYPSWYLDRFAVKPGLTGLWQVSGRNERTYEEMVRLDIEYAERRSLLLDISILARTPFTVLARRGAA